MAGTHNPRGARDFAGGLSKGVTQGPANRIPNRGPCVNADVAEKQDSGSCRDYGKTNSTGKGAQLSATVEVAGGFSTHLDDRVLRSFPLHISSSLSTAPGDGASRAFLIRANSRTNSRNFAAMKEHPRFNEAGATDLEPLGGNRCRTASWSPRTGRVDARTAAAPTRAATPVECAGHRGADRGHKNFNSAYKALR